MNKQQIINKYIREANNLNHNIKHELNKPILYNEQTDTKILEYMRGQLSIIREVVHMLRNEYEYLDNLPCDLRLSYRLGDAI